MPTDPFAGLPAKDRRPPSARVLDQWVTHAQRIVGGRGSRTGWILASTITIAALQRALGADAEPLFLLKGGVYLERRLGLASRATKDLDTLFRGEVEEFVAALDEALHLPWGDISLSRTDIATINAPRLVKPRRFDVILSIKGVTWRRIQVEVAFSEGSIGNQTDRLAAPSSGFFGVPAVAELVGITMDYQVAQKLHACSDPHRPPEFKNDRVRDIVDLLLIRDTFYTGPTHLGGIRLAVEDVFTARADEAQQLGLKPRHWPPLIETNPLWELTYAKPASDVDMTYTLTEAIFEVNAWITRITQD